MNREQGTVLCLSEKSFLVSWNLLKQHQVGIAACPGAAVASLGAASHFFRPSFSLHSLGFSARPLISLFVHLSVIICV